MIAETAKLAVDLSLHNGLGPGVATAEGELSSLNRAASGSVGHTSRLSQGFGVAGRAAGGFGGALSHARGKIGELISGPLGMIGLGAGLFSLAGAFEQSVEKAKEMAFTVEKISGVTGLGATKVSELLGALDNFGVSGDSAVRVFSFIEKSVGKLTQTAAKATAFQKLYGVSLTDAKGRAIDAEQVLLKVADYYTSNASAAQKAALATALLGRNYVQLVPLLKQGSAGIRAAEEEAAKLGLTLTSKNVADLAKFRNATRELDDTMSGLKLQIGLALIPTLTELSRTVSTFVQQNREGIVAFFRGFLDFAKEAASAVRQFVLPAFGAIGHAWGMVPPQIRQLILAGLVGNKVLKVVFGFDPLKILTGSLSGIIGKQIGGIFGRGGSPANPVWVAEAGGGPGGIGGKGGGLSPLGVGLAAAGGLFIAAQWKGMFQDPQFNAQLHDIRATASRSIQQRPGLAGLNSGLAGINQGLHDISNAGPLSDLLYGDQIRQLTRLRDQYIRAIAAEEKRVSAATAKSNAGLFARMQGQATDHSRSENTLAVTDLKRTIHNERTTPEIVAHGVKEGNRDVAKARDISDLKLTIGMGLNDVRSGIQSIEAAGFSAVVAAVQALGGVIGGLASIGTGAAAQGRVAGKRGDKAAPLSAARGNSRAGFSSGPLLSQPTSVHVNVNSSARSNEQARTIQFRYGPVPSSAGSA